MNGKEKETEFIKIYNEAADDIFRHLYFRVYDYERAKELTQESFIRAWKYVAQGREIDNMKALVYKIATNMAIDESRKKKAVSLDAIMEAGAEINIVADNNMVIKSEAAIVLQKMQKLNEYERNLVLMRYIQQMGIREIAEIMGKKENAISVGLNRAIKKLKKYV